MARYSLRLTSLKFISAVDTPAQETAAALLLKRKGKEPGMKATARAVKFVDELGLVFGWALTSKSDGEKYFDLHDDHIVEDDLIKVAAEFMQESGLSDQMHDRDPDGKIVFCMPLTAEVAKAFGIAADTTGLMIAMKPSPEVFAKFKSGELTGFSIDGEGFREEIAKSRVAKSQLYTDEVDGHQHTISIYDDNSFYTSYATAAGAEHGHGHVVVLDGGELTILADSGHTHVLAEGQAAVVVVPQDAVIVVQSSATPTKNAKNATPVATKSTHQPQISKVDTMSDIEKKLQRLERIAKMSGAHKTHFDALTGDDADEFLAKSAGERETQLQKARELDAVLHTCEDGTVIKRSDGALALKFAKQADEAIKLAQVEKAAREHTELVKRADSTLGALAGDDASHVALLKAVESIADATVRANAEKTLVAANAAMKSQSKAPGAGDDQAPGANTAVAKFNAERVKFAKTKFATETVTDAQVRTVTSEFVQTRDGGELYADAYPTTAA